ncbi:hypothetical protein TNCV_2790671 [Trichonephila clavipes]|nr:hypothetical protein TNCV_2790671 [Trichonephila clavipes]
MDYSRTSNTAVFPLSRATWSPGTRSSLTTVPKNHSQWIHSGLVFLHYCGHKMHLLAVELHDLVQTRSIADELKLVVPDNAKVLDLRELIQESEIYKNDKETYQAIVDCVLEEINDRRNENENRLEIEKIKLSQLEKELEIARLHNQSGKSLPLQNEN